MLCDKLVEFTPREEVDAIQQQLLEDVNDRRKQTEEWGAQVETQLKQYLSVNDFQSVLAAFRHTCRNRKQTSGQRQLRLNS